ncbi:MAG: hypothetical protein WBP45_01815 [Daejeonella sp.]
MRFILTIFAISLFFSACQKQDDFTTDTSAKLSFSTDSILFDTVFTSIGSTTRRLKVFNPNKKAVKISQIKLAGGNTSPYQININGLPVNQANAVELAGNDSLYIFIKVNINPNNDALPFIVADSLLFETNGNQQKVQLAAYGQNANFLNGENINQNTTWHKPLPYVIYNSVFVNQNVQLTIAAGSKIYFHKGSKLIVAGSLSAEGSVKDSVIFSGDRFEPIYLDEPGQWGGLHFLSTSFNNQLNHAIIKNALIGIRVDGLSINNNPKLLLTNSTIKNIEVSGLAMFNTDVKAFNNLIFNCGQYLVYGVLGGVYDFKQNTFSALNLNFTRQTPAVYFTDFYTSNNSNQTALLEATLANNIIWGSLDEELVFEKKGIAEPDITLMNNLLKTKTPAFSANGNLINTDPLFINAIDEKYQLSTGSPAINKGTDLSSDAWFNPYLSTDRSGKARTFPSDLGCYEF